MARFIGGADGRTAGASGETGFTRAKVFTSSTAFTIPATSKKAKVYVIGAGSCYRTTTYDFCGASCCSGVAYPQSDYCACFIGHLTGAGGGYAEKTWANDVGGKTMNITIGTIGGSSASSVVFEGDTVTATNATETSYSWSCTGNSTARDNSGDNPISGGFQVPICGYKNIISGYRNAGGTSTGGDINRTGGKGIVIPEFRYDSYLDGGSDIATTTAAGFTGNASSCWVNPTFYCTCMGGYHYVFGVDCRSNAWQGTSCGCYYLCAGISNLCANAGTYNCNYIASRYRFAGFNNTQCSCGGIGARETMPGNGMTDNARNALFKAEPAGVGAQPGHSSANGKDGVSEMVVSHTTFARTNFTETIGGGSNTCVDFQRCSGGYDYSFGGTGTTCFCMKYYPGCFSTCAAFTPDMSNVSWCYICVGQIWRYVFGYQQSGCCICTQFPYGTGASATTQCCCRVTERCYDLAYVNDDSLRNQPNSYVIPLSGYLSENGGNINDIEYGAGAGLATAGYGAGGNRLNPAGGQGLVVVIY
jgi:hypothetical protein